MATATQQSGATVVEEEVTRELDTSINQWIIVLKRIQKNRVAMVAFYYIILNVLIAIFYPVLLSENPLDNTPGKNEKFGGGTNAFPNLKYPAGVDQLGRDAFSRMLVGAEVSILVGLIATGISLIIGVIIGLMAGYYQGRVEETLMRFTDLVLSVPFLLFAILLVSLIVNGEAYVFNDVPQVWIIAMVIGLFGWAGLARLVTANVKQVSSLEYVSAVRIMGASDKRIIFVHIFPNVLAPIIVLGALFIAGAILSEAGLAFLGLGDPANTVSWGILVSQARPVFAQHPEQALIPGFAIFFLVLAINLFGDALRDALDPKLKD